MASRSTHSDVSNAGSTGGDDLTVRRPITVTLAVFLIIGVLVPMGAIIAVTYRSNHRAHHELTAIAQRELADRAFDHLVSIREIKKAQIEAYFDQALRDAGVFARSRDVAVLFAELRRYHDETDVKADGPYDVTTQEYERIWKGFGDNILQYRADSGVYDMFVICAAHGHVMYSCARKPDVGTNLAAGPYKDSGLGALWSRVKASGEAVFVDFAAYAPSDGEPAAFVGVPIPADTGETIGVMAIRLHLRHIDAIMLAKEGLGETGGTYLVGEDHFLRCDSALDHTPKTVVESFKSRLRVDSESVTQALDGETGYGNTTLRAGDQSHEILSAYTAVDAAGVRWALLAEIDAAEAFAAGERLEALHEQEERAMLAWAVGISGFAVLVVVAGGIAARQRIAVRIRGMAQAATAMANGDLDVRVPSDGGDEIGVLGAAMNRMAASLGRVRAQVASTASKLESASREQAAGAANQSTATTQLSTTATEMLAAARQMSENGASVAQQADGAARECADGTKNIESAVTGIEGIRERVEKVAEHMLGLGSKSQHISGVLDIINELSEQTNLLSLNASIEAAGAGEAGKRFAVVASEIRKLAERAAESTTEIRGLIDGIQETVNSTIMATEEGSKSVEQGVRLTSEAKGAFDRIATQVASTTQSAKSIEMASRQQATALEQMDGAVRSIDTAAKQSEASSHQVQAETTALVEASRQLRGSDRTEQQV